MSENNMNLQDFISTSLSQIIHGISDAQELVADTNAIIQPAKIAGAGNLSDILYVHERGPVSTVEFDVALTVTEGTEHESRIGVLLGSIGGSAGARGRDEFGSAHRVKFSIPILYPGGADKLPA